MTPQVPVVNWLVMACPVTLISVFFADDVHEEQHRTNFTMIHDGSQ